MNAFTRHLHEQDITYAEHWLFAMGIAWRLLSSVAAFTLHAMMPFISIKRRLDLEATAAFLNERNRLIAGAATHRSKVRIPLGGRNAANAASM